MEDPLLNLQFSNRISSIDYFFLRIILQFFEEMGLCVFKMQYMLDILLCILPPFYGEGAEAQWGDGHTISRQC